MKLSKLAAFVMSAIAILWPSQATPQEAPALLDWASLGLRVTNVEVVTEVVFRFTDPEGPHEQAVRSKEGYNLVTVTLEGKNRHSSYIGAALTDFDAIYDREFTGDKGEKGFTTEFQDAVAFGTLIWMLVQRTNPGKVFWVSKPGPFTLRLAFYIPTDVDRFFVRYPGMAKGEVRLPSGSQEKSRSEGN